MKRLVALAALALCAGAVAGGAAAAIRDDSISSNWAGYAVSGTDPATGTTTQFRVVSGAWVVPSATCGSSPTWSAVWVGLGGASPTSQALEQIGTEADCTLAGSAAYSAWYELVPAPSTPLRLKVFPGDHMNAVVVVHGSEVILRLRDLTRHTVFTKTATAAPLDLTSAEWVVEAPSSCDSAQHCEVLPLTNFGSVPFTGVATIGDDHTGTAADGHWIATPIELLTHDRVGLVPMQTPGAVPSALGADGGSFTVDYSSALTPPAPGQTHPAH